MKRRHTRSGETALLRERERCLGRERDVATAETSEMPVGTAVGTAVPRTLSKKAVTEGRARPEGNRGPHRVRQVGVKAARTSRICGTSPNWLPTPVRARSIPGATKSLAEVSSTYPRQAADERGRYRRRQGAQSHERGAS
mmetsp:Transcript_60078/g.159796  ORF Transcript_60078/g.159796 Transcript_60078/m.159796 type:complete len:140 (+) Transcript_60078:1917-2336(+)